MRPSFRPAGHRPHGPSMNPTRPTMNGARPYKSFFQTPSYETRPFLKSSAVKNPYRAPWVPTVNRYVPPVNRKFSTGRRNFPTANRKFPTVSRKFTTGSTKNHTADMGRKGKAVKPSACWTWNPSQELSNKAPMLGVFAGKCGLRSWEWCGGGGVEGSGGKCAGGKTGCRCDSRWFERGREKSIFGYHSTQSKGYRVYNKSTRLIVESIHLQFDEIKEMSEMSVANDTSSLVPQRQKASDYDNSDPVPQLQNVSPSADTTIPSQQELDLLFGPLYDEFFTADPEMCMFALTLSTAELKNIKESMADSAWIEAMQEELHQFDRLQVWELIDKPFGKNVDSLKCFFIISSIAVQTPDSGISNLLGVGTTFTGSGNLYCQWELSSGSGNALCILFSTLDSRARDV
nr:hypothetical protein [Tanacetum cinerariifolium]